MVKRISLSILLFLLCYLVFLLATMPAQIVWEYGLKKQISPKSGVTVSAVEGSIWNGKALISVQGVRAIVGWELGMPELSTGSLPLDLNVDSEAGSLDGTLLVGSSRQTVLLNEAEIDAPALNPILRKQRVKLAGKVLLNGLKVVVDEQQVVDLDGRFSWSGGAIAYPVGRRVKNEEFPAFFGAFTREGEVVKLGIRDREADFDVIDGELGPDGVAMLRVKRRILDLANEKWPSNSTEQDVVFKVKRPLKLDIVQK